MDFPDKYLFERCRFSRRNIKYFGKLLELTFYSFPVFFSAIGIFLYSEGDAEYVNKATVCGERFAMH